MDDARRPRCRCVIVMHGQEFVCTNAREPGAVFCGTCTDQHADTYLVEIGSWQTMIAEE